MTGGTALVTLSGIGKSFAGQAALTDVDLAITAGAVHAIVGENGAGKSTLGKIIGGVYRQDRGRMCIDGVQMVFRNPSNALDAGIAIMQQEIALAPHLTAIENVFLGNEPRRYGFVDTSLRRDRYDALIEMTQFDLPANSPVGELPLAAQQQVEILRALARNARLIVMDEPTAALPATAAEHLRRVVHLLCARGVSVVYVSHFLEETLALSDTVTVLRNGRLIDTQPASDWTVGSMVAAMLGRSLEASYPSIRKVDADSPARLSVDDLGVHRQLSGCSLSIKKGEIVGLFGLVGSGRSEFAHVIFGAETASSGTMTLDGVDYAPHTPRDALDSGVALLPESRKDQGVFLDHSKKYNVGIGHLAQHTKAGFVKARRETQATKMLLDACAVSVTNLDLAVRGLSGGNQQKVLLAKTLASKPRLLILDEPTRGVDVGARRSIYDTIARLVESGMSVILISSDIEEVQRMSHRLYIMRDGSITREFCSQTASHADILNEAFGLEYAN